MPHGNMILAGKVSGGVGEVGGKCAGSVWGVPWKCVGSAREVLVEVISEAIGEVELSTHICKTSRKDVLRNCARGPNPPPGIEPGFSA